LLGLGVFLVKEAGFNSSDKIQVLDATTDDQNSHQEIIVEIAGEVEKPGVYRLPKNSRVEDLLLVAGGLSVNSDRVWVEKALNRVSILTDGQKIYIPAVGEQFIDQGANFSGSGGNGNVYKGSSLSGLININTASQKLLESLPGIGPVYAQKIIEHRPYSNIEELRTKGVLKDYIFKKIKDKISVF